MSGSCACSSQSGQVTMRRSPRCARRSRRAFPTRAGGRPSTAPFEHRRWLSAGSGADRLSNGAPDWSRQFLRIDWQTAAAGALFGEISRSERFDESDSSLSAGGNLEGVAGMAARRRCRRHGGCAVFAGGRGRRSMRRGAGRPGGERLSAFASATTRPATSRATVLGRKVHRRLSHSLPARPLAPVGRAIRH